jgi:hypothetical protein
MNLGPLAYDAQSLERRRAFHLKLLIYVSAVAALSTALVYISRMHLEASFWLSTTGIGTLFMILPVFVPYLVLAKFIGGQITAVHWRVGLYAVVMFGVSVLVDLFISGSVIPVAASDLLECFAGQMVVYVVAAAFLLDAE